MKKEDYFCDVCAVPIKNSHVYTLISFGLDHCCESCRMTIGNTVTNKVIEIRKMAGQYPWKHGGAIFEKDGE